MTLRAPSWDFWSNATASLEANRKVPCQILGGDAPPRAVGSGRAQVSSIVLRGSPAGSAHEAHLRLGELLTPAHLARRTSTTGIRLLK